MDPTAFTAAVDAFIRQAHLVRRGTRMVVAVSGGADSILLLHVLHELAAAWAWQLHVAHFNHQLRGSASDRDETLVSETACALGIPSTTGREDVRRFAQDQGISIEMAARQCRHRFLAATARTQGMRTVALAHQADDQVEGFFLRLLRGSGLEGLLGMKPRAISPVDHRIWLVRPLLNHSRQAILAQATQRGLVWHEDASNARLEPMRNRIRHQLLPLLRDQYQPAIAPVILRTLELLRGEAELLDLAAHSWPDTVHQPWTTLPLALQRRRIQSQLQRLGFTVDFDLVERLRSSPDTPWAVAPHEFLCLDSAGKLRRFQHQTPGFSPERLGVPLTPGHGQLQFAQRILSWNLHQLQKPTHWSSLRPPGGEVFDADQVGSSMVLRHWQPGDRFRPSGLPHRAKLQDLFVAAKIFCAERHHRIVAHTAAGVIFWVEGLRIGHEFRVTRSTRNALRWLIRDR
jgi:tRNA(Ile)-lysidine synthase